MAKELFDVCLTGKLLTGHNRREVTVNLAQLVGTSIPQAETLLDGAICVKSQVDEATAALYQEIIEETGAEALIRVCLAEADQHAPAEVADDEVRFDPLPEMPVVGHKQPEPTLPPLQPNLAPEQRFETESTPVLDDEPPQLAPNPPDQDTTQPFATPLPAPLARRRRRILTLGGGVLVLLVGLAAGFRWLLPAPVVPGQAIPLVGEALNLAQPFQQQVEQFWRARGQPPRSLADLLLAEPVVLGEQVRLAVKDDGTLVLTFGDELDVIAGQTLELQPARGEQGFEWSCVGGSLSALERPLECRRTLVK